MGCDGGFPAGAWSYIKKFVPSSLCIPLCFSSTAIFSSSFQSSFRSLILFLLFVFRTGIVTGGPFSSTGLKKWSNGGGGRGGGGQRERNKERNGGGGDHSRLLCFSVVLLVCWCPHPNLPAFSFLFFHSALFSDTCYPYPLRPCEHHTTGSRPPCGDIVPTPPCPRKCVNGAVWDKVRFVREPMDS